MYSRILVPIDTTYKTDAWTKGPLTVACEMARQSEGLIHVMSVIPRNLLEGYYPDMYTDEVAEETRRKLEAIVKRYCPPDAAVELSVAEGGICNNILAVARDLPADVIVIASHGPLIRDYLLGSNAGYIALHAPCSVLVARESQTATSSRFLKFAPDQREKRSQPVSI